MKKLTTLVLAAGLVVSAFAGSASAGEFKPNLQFAEEFTYGDAGHDSSENFNASTRIRFGFDYIASEDLSATMLFQYRKGSWGNNGDDFTSDPAVNGDGAGDHFRMRLAYIDWTVPGTEVKVRMGRQPIVTPSYAFGSAILDGRGDAIKVAANINENISVGAAWVRLNSDTQSTKYNAITGVATNHNDDIDAFMVNAEFAYDGFKVAPWAMYVSAQKGATENMDHGIVGVGNGSNPLIVTAMPVAGDPEVFYGSGALDAYVLGISAELNMFDPFVFAVDALYNNIKFHDVASDDPVEDSFDGFYVGAKGSYKLSNGTAALGAWYASGADDRANHKNDTGFVLLDGGFGAGTILYGDNIIGADAYNTLTGDTPFGTWGIVAEYAGFSFLENLTHTARVVYVEGTNEIDNNANETLDFGFITEDDSLVEVDFNSTYQIYKNFSATLELGYVFVDQSNLAADEEEKDDIFRSALTFVYKF